MNQSERDNAGVIAPPGFFNMLLVAGLVLHFVFPVHFLPPGWLQLAIGLPLIGIGIILNAWARTTMGRAGTNIDPYKPTTVLVVHGPFGFSRNPVYLSGTVAYLGVAISLNALWPMVLLPVVLLIVTVGVIRREERYLERRFGEEYLRYKARVRRWL